MEGIYHDADLKDSPLKKTVVYSPNIAQTSDFSNLPINLRFEEKSVSIQNGSHTLFEERSLRLTSKDTLRVFTPYIGQEAVAFPSVSVMSEDDHVITAYRDLPCTCSYMDMDECMAELFGKRTGCSKGMGGSMHFLHLIKLWGGHIVGGQHPVCIAYF